MLTRKIKLWDINAHITCRLCSGYLIDATTVTECLHTFCRSCLVKYLEENNTCPTCRIVIHQSHPLQYIGHDRTMQDIVYKLVPGLQEGACGAPAPAPGCLSPQWAGQGRAGHEAPPSGRTAICPCSELTGISGWSPPSSVPRLHPQPGSPGVGIVRPALSGLWGHSWYGCQSV